MDIPLQGWVLDETSSQTLTDQLYTLLRSRLISGELRAGQRLPASRKLCQELGVSRTTVTRVYDQLLAEGFVYTRQGSGVFVANVSEVERLEGRPLQKMWALQKRQAQSPVVQSVRSSFPHRTGSPDETLFPYREWARAMSRVARVSPQSVLHEDDPCGDQVLRAEICRYVQEWRGVVASPDQVVVTAGALGALELAMKTIQASVIGLEDPCYPPLYHFLKDRHLHCHWLQVDVHGAQLPVEKLDTVVLTPSLQFPLGGIMSYGRRLEFLAWAQTHDVMIIEDDFDSEFRYAGRPIPALTSLDESGHTLYVGSFSKVVSRNLRLGYVIFPKALIPRMQEAVGWGTQASRMPQPVLAEFMASGQLYRHIRRVRRIYGERRELMLSGLRKIFGDIAVQDHKAGLHLVVHLPETVLDQKLADQIRAHGYGVQALSRYAIYRQDLSGLLINFADVDEETIPDMLRCVSDAAYRLK